MSGYFRQIGTDVCLKLGSHWRSFLLRSGALYAGWGGEGVVFHDRTDSGNAVLICPGRESVI